jgi:hypothetical protein
MSHQQQVESSTWCEGVVGFLGRETPTKLLGVKGRDARVRVMWMREEFRECPLGANEAIVTLYASACVWHMFATVLFPDGMGDAASLMYISALANWDEARSYSWGSTVLAYLYHQLCEACGSRGQNSGFGCCVYLLHVSSTTSFYFLNHLLLNSGDTCYLH